MYSVPLKECISPFHIKFFLWRQWKVNSAPGKVLYKQQYTRSRITLCAIIFFAASEDPPDTVANLPRNKGLKKALLLPQTRASQEGIASTPNLRPLKKGFLLANFAASDLGSSPSWLGLATRRSAASADWNGGACPAEAVCHAACSGALPTTGTKFAQRVWLCWQEDNSSMGSSGHGQSRPHTLCNCMTKCLLKGTVHELTHRASGPKALVACRGHSRTGWTSKNWATALV